MVLPATPRPLEWACPPNAWSQSNPFTAAPAGVPATSQAHDPNGIAAPRKMR